MSLSFLAACHSVRMPPAEKIPGACVSAAEFIGGEPGTDAGELAQRHMKNERYKQELLQAGYKSFGSAEPLRRQNELSGTLPPCTNAALITTIPYQKN
jgi:hypothetical protein